MLQDEITDPNDPVVVKEEAHLRTIMEMKEELLEALNTRKGKALKIALQIFNKVQEQNLSTFRLDDVKGENKGEVKSRESLYGNIEQILQKYELLINSARSPIYSALQELGQYKGDKNFPGFRQLYQDGNDMITNRVDLKKMKLEHEKLQSIFDDLATYHATLKNINSILIKEQEEMNKLQTLDRKEVVNESE